MKEIIDRKFANLDAYLEKYPIESFILGLSGGVDSAVVAKLLNLYNKERGYKYKIHLLSIFYRNGVGGKEIDEPSNQDYAAETTAHLHSHLKAQNTIFHVLWHDSYDRTLGGYHTDSPLAIFDSEGYPKTWLLGQFNANLRSVYFYHFANAYNGVVCGTINKSEYLTGYWGKFCDAQVDLQFLFDLYKTEVYELAKYLGVPDFIIKRTPTGDTHNNKTDEDILGANWFEIDEIIKKSSYWVGGYFSDKPNPLIQENELPRLLSYYPNEKFWRHIIKNQFKFEYTPQGIFI